jgi:hypothetical protein
MTRKRPGRQASRTEAQDLSASRSTPIFTLQPLAVRAEIQRLVKDPTVPPMRKQAAIQTLQRVLASLEEAS